jgi:hypothetical protein
MLVWHVLLASLPGAAVAAARLRSRRALMEVMAEAPDPMTAVVVVLVGGEEEQEEEEEGGGGIKYEILFCSRSWRSPRAGRPPVPM